MSDPAHDAREFNRLAAKWLGGDRTVYFVVLKDWDDVKILSVWLTLTEALIEHSRILGHLTAQAAQGNRVSVSELEVGKLFDFGAQVLRDLGTIDTGGLGTGGGTK